jgi:hypothetical protein
MHHQKHLLRGVAEGAFRHAQAPEVSPYEGEMLVVNGVEITWRSPLGGVHGGS